MNSKAKGVMEALNSRKSFDPKKGVSLLAIVQKLSEKRKLGKDGPSHESSESSSKETTEGTTE